MTLPGEAVEDPPTWEGTKDGSVFTKAAGENNDGNSPRVSPATGSVITEGGRRGGIWSDMMGTMTIHLAVRLFRGLSAFSDKDIKRMT